MNDTELTINTTLDGREVERVTFRLRNGAWWAIWEDGEAMIVTKARLDQLPPEHHRAFFANLVDFWAHWEEGPVSVETFGLRYDATLRHWV